MTKDVKRERRSKHDDGSEEGAERGITLCHVCIFMQKGERSIGSDRL